jgi:hypothetical protein
MAQDRCVAPTAIRLGVWFALTAVLAVGLVAPAPAAAQDDAPDAPPSVPEADDAAAPDAAPGEAQEADDRVIFVPYKDLQKALDGPEGVFLPYEEFLELWRKAHAKQPDDQPAAATVVRKVGYTGAVDGDTATFTVALQLRILVDGWVRMELPFAGAVSLRNAAIAVGDGPAEEALLHGSSRGVAWMYHRKADSPRDVTLALEFETRTREVPGRADHRMITFPLPPAPIAELDLTVDQPNLAVEIAPQLAGVRQTAVGDDATRVQTFLGAADSLRVTWKTEVARTEQEAVVNAQQNTRVTYRNGLVELQSEIALTAVQGMFDEIIVVLPDEFTLHMPEGGDWLSYAPLPRGEDDDGPAKLQVLLREPRNAYTVRITMEKVVGDITTETAVPLVKVDGVNERGVVAVFAQDNLDVTPGEVRGVTQATAADAPFLRGAQPALLYQFLEVDDVALPVTITRRKPELTVRANHRFAISETQLTYRANLHCKVEKAGLFRMRLYLPEGYEPSAIEPRALIRSESRPVLDDAEAEGAPSRHVVDIEFTAMQQGDFTLQLDFVRAVDGEFPLQGDAEPRQVDLPIVRVAGAKSERGHYGIFAADTLNVEVADDPVGLKPLGGENLYRAYGSAPAPVGDAAQPVGGKQYLLTGDEAAPSATQPLAGATLISRKKPLVTVEAVNYVRVGDELIERTTYLFYTIEFAGVDTFDVRVVDNRERGGDQAPKFAADGLSQNPPGRDDPEVEGAKLYTVTLPEKRRGLWVLTLTWQENVAGLAPNTEEALQFPHVAAVNVANQFGSYLLAKSPTAHLGKPTMDNVTPEDPANAEVRTRVERLTNARADIGDELPEIEAPILAFRYVQPDHDLSLVLARREFSEIFTVMVHRLHLEAKLNEDFSLAVAMLIDFQARNQQALTVKLPAGAQNIRVVGPTAPRSPTGSARRRRTSMCR